MAEPKGRKYKKSELGDRDPVVTRMTSSENTNEDYVLRYVLQCRDEAAEARRNRMDLNATNYDMYHLEHDFSHKKAGQSMEVLPKEKMAVEQTKSFFQQALADIGEWMKVVSTSGLPAKPDALITPEEVYKLTNFMLKQAKYFDHVGNSVWYALLGSLAITQVTGRMVPKAKYVVRKGKPGSGYSKKLELVEDKTWQLAFNEIRQANYYPDPTGKKVSDGGLYEIMETFTDKYHVLAAAEGDYAIYDKSEVDELESWGSNDEDYSGNGAPLKTQETGQNPDNSGWRPRVKLTRFYGNIVDEDTGKLLYENVYVTVANDKCVIQKPTENPFWHQGSDIIAAPLLSVPGSVWHTALMDSPAKLNSAMTELFNLIMDAAFSSVHGTKQLRTDWLADSSSVNEGFPQGSTIEVSSIMPVGGKVLEDVVVGTFPQQVLNVANLIQQEYNASALTSDLRGGVTPQRQQSATAVVEQGNTITSVFQGIAKNVEVNIVQPELTRSWQNIAQNWDLIDKEIFISIFGQERGTELSQLDPEDVFAETVNGMKFEVFGISLTMNQKLEYQKFITLLQTVGASPLFQEAFIGKYDPAKVLGEIISTLGIDKKKIELDSAQLGAPPPEQPGVPAGPDEMSQVPQPGSGSDSVASILGAGGGPQPAAGQVG
jgi:hypothetical protein